MIVFDLETIPSDAALAARDVLMRRDDCRTEADFVRYCSTHPALCRVVAWGVESLTETVRNVDCHADEAALIAALGKAIGNAPFVTFNGHGFDLPVLRHRSRILGIDEPLFVRRSAAQKPWETHPHTDLAQLFRGGGRMQSLESYCIAYGIQTPKQGAVSASSVWDAWQRGDHDEIADYCMRDVLATAELARRWGVA